MELCKDVHATASPSEAICSTTSSSKQIPEKQAHMPTTVLRGDVQRSSGGSNACSRTTTGCLRFHPMAQCVVHALKGLARRALGLLVYAEVTET